MGERAQREAWVTLATNDAYALGCLVLGNSLRRVHTTRQLVIMISGGVSLGMRQQLQHVFDSLVDVDVLDSEDARNLALLGRPDLNVTYTKIHCWELVQYDKCVFLDADTLVIQNSDELFDREEFSAAPDAGWPDCFNSGVFVFRPSLETYQALLSFAGTKGSFDGGDQGLLNSFYDTWPTADIQKHLPFVYNVVSQAFYSYLPAFTQFRNTIKIVHFIGPIKPWNHPYNTATQTVTVFPETGHCQEFLQMWWDLFMQMVQPRLDPTVWVALARAYILVNLASGASCRVVWLFIHTEQWGARSCLIKKVTVMTERMEELLKEEKEKGTVHTPFIRYEYVLPSSSSSSFPPPPPPSQQGQEDLTPPPPEEEHQHQHQPPSSYQVHYPYVPPVLDQPMWGGPPQEALPSSSSPPHHHPPPPSPPHHEAHDVYVEAHIEGNTGGVVIPPEVEPSRVIEMPIVFRAFHPYETHYAEVPLLLLDPDSLPPALYESQQFEQSLAQEAEKLKPDEPGGEPVISVLEEGGSGGGVSDSAKGDGRQAGVEVSHLGDGGDGDLQESEKLQSAKEDAKKKAEGGGAKEDSGGKVSQGRDVNSNHVEEEKGSAGGLVGELAQLSVGGGGAGGDYIVLDDRERRLAWERGHADYMGMDSFANIMKKLDQKMVPTPASGKEATPPGKEEATPPGPAAGKKAEGSPEESREAKAME